MGFKEIVLGSDWKEKTKAEKLTRLSKVFDVGTVFLGLVASGVAPALASTMITAAVGTFSFTEAGEKSFLSKKKKK